MSNNYFKFQKFTIWQDKTAMKVGTDGVLLGVLSTSSCKVRRVLDIGTGTGVVALIIAQRFNNALIDAVEIDFDAASQASDNFKLSPFADRLKIYNSDISDYHTAEKYDLIVCNPPYFVDSLRNPNQQRAIARHTITLTFESLAKAVSRLLDIDGIFSVIVPSDAVNNIVKTFAEVDLYKSSQIDIKTTPNKPIKRSVINFSFVKETNPTNKTIVIETSPLVYSEEFERLIHDYYLPR